MLQTWHQILNFKCVLKMWRMDILIRHQCGERNHIVGHRCIKGSKKLKIQKMLKILRSYRQKCVKKWKKTLKLKNIQKAQKVWSFGQQLRKRSNGNHAMKESKRTILSPFIDIRGLKLAARSIITNYSKLIFWYVFLLLAQYRFMTL